MLEYKYNKKKEMEKRIDKLSKKRTRFVKTVANEEIEPSPTYDDESTPPIEPP